MIITTANKKGMSRVAWGLMAILCSLSLGSCIERVDLIAERNGGQLIVDGRFTDEFAEQSVFLGYTSDNTSIPSPIRDARIRLFDDHGGTDEYVPDSQRPGVYVLSGNRLRAVVGYKYHIEIALPNGQQYRSEPEELLASAATLESVSYDFEVREEVNDNAIITTNPYIDIYADVDLSPSDGKPYFLRWDVEEVYKLTPTDFPDPFGNIPPPCYVSVFTSSTNPVLVDGTIANTRRLEKLLVASQEVDQTFAEKHYFSIYQRTLTPKAYAYWEKVAKLVTNSGSIFDSPPAPIQGNVYNIDDESEEVLGFFEVSSTEVQRFFTLRFDLPIDLILECTYSSFKASTDYPDECLNCIKVRNSSFARPFYFD